MPLVTAEKSIKGGLCLVGDDPRERRFAHARRAPEDHRGNLVALNQAAQHLARAQKMGLAHIFFQRARAQPGGQRLRRPALKQVVCSIVSLQPVIFLSSF